MKLSNYAKGLSSIVVSAFGFATIGTLGVLLFNGGANPITILIGRFLVATILLLVTLFFWNKELFKVAKGDIKWFLLSGFILLSQLLTFWYGFKIVKSVAIQYSLFFTYPIWIAILAYPILKEKIGKIVPVCLGIGVIGVLMVLGIIPNGFTTVPISGIRKNLGIKI